MGNLQISIFNVDVVRIDQQRRSSFLIWLRPSIKRPCCCASNLYWKKPHVQAPTFLQLLSFLALKAVDNQRTIATCLACLVSSSFFESTGFRLIFPPASVDLDQCIESLYKKNLLAESVIEAICAKTKELLMQESNVVHVQAPVTVVGDIHGQFYDLIEIFKIGGWCPDTNYLFLGTVYPLPRTPR